MNAHTHIETAPSFPIVYAMQIDAPNGAGEYQHGDLALFNAIEEPHAGDIVCVHTKRDGAVLVTLDAHLAPGMFDNMFRQAGYGGEIEPMVVGTILGTDRRIALRASSVWAVHKCDGKADPEECCEDDHS